MKPATRPLVSRVHLSIKTTWSCPNSACTVKPAIRPLVSRDHLSIKTTWSCPNSACTIDYDLCKETTSLRTNNTILLPRGGRYRQVSRYIYAVTLTYRLFSFPSPAMTSEMLSSSGDDDVWRMSERQAADTGSAPALVEIPASNYLVLSVTIFRSLVRL